MAAGIFALLVAPPLLASTCGGSDNGSAPRVEVAASVAPLTVRRVASPTLQPGATASSRHRVGGRVLGTTGYEVALRVELDSARLPIGPDCHRLRAARLTATLRQEVRIDRRYAPGSCEARRIRAHEDRHVAIDRDAFLRLAPQAEGRFAAALAPLGQRARQHSALQAEVDAQLRAVGGWLVAELARLTRAQHRALDTPDSYRRWLGGCGNW